MRSATLAALAAATVASVLVVAAPAHADPEIELIRCSGEIPSDQLRREGWVFGAGTISCEKGHYGTDDVPPMPTFVPWFTATMDLITQNWSQTMGLMDVYLSNGNWTFTVGGKLWRLVFEAHLTHDGVLVFEAGRTNAIPEDWIGPSAVREEQFHIQEGWIVARSCYVPFIYLENPPCVNGFQFTGEYVHELPVRT